MRWPLHVDRVAPDGGHDAGHQRVGVRARRKLGHAEDRDVLSAGMLIAPKLPRNSTGADTVLYPFPYWRVRATCGLYAVGPRGGFPRQPPGL